MPVSTRCCQASKYSSLEAGGVTPSAIITASNDFICGLRFKACVFTYIFPLLVLRQFFCLFPSASIDIAHLLFDGGAPNFVFFELCCITHAITSIWVSLRLMVISPPLAIRIKASSSKGRFSAKSSALTWYVLSHRSSCLSCLGLYPLA